MKNTATNVAVYEVTGQLYNPYLDSACEKALIPVTYSKQGVARAWWGYSNHVMATAGGYGYDKESTVLARAVAILARNTQILKCEGVGTECVIERANDCLITVKRVW